MARKNREDNQEFEDLSSYSSSKEYKKHRKNRRGLTLAGAAATAACVLLVVVGAVMVFISTHMDGLTTTAITKDPDKLGITSPAVASAEGVTNIAFFGVDARNDEFAGPSDFLMIVSVDTKREKIKMTSILRDSKVLIEGTTLNGEHIDWDTKISTAYQQGGPELAIRTLNRNFGMDIRNYVTVNFMTMAEIVDLMGGVEVRLTAEEVREINVNLNTLIREVEQQREKDRLDGVSDRRSYPEIDPSDFIPDASGIVNVNSGNYVGGVFRLNGNQAVAYGRIRSVDSDAVRADRQQVVLSQLISSLETVVDLSGLIRQVLDRCETSLKLADILALTPVLSGELSLESIKVPDSYYETDLTDGTAEDGITYAVFDVTEAARRINAFIYEEDSSYWESYGDTGRDAVRQSAFD